MPALRVSNHLYLVNDHDLVSFLQREHLDRTAVQRRAIYYAPLVAGEQATRAREERVAVFEHRARGAGYLHVEIGSLVHLVGFGGLCAERDNLAGVEPLVDFVCEEAERTPVCSDARRGERT
jgi:hypothetical protein